MKISSATKLELCCTAMLSAIFHNFASLTSLLLSYYIICYDYILFTLVSTQRRAYLQQALKLIRSCAEKTDGSADGSKAFSGEIIILCAEVACQVGVILCQSCSHMMLLSSPTYCLQIFYCTTVNLVLKICMIEFFNTCFCLT